MHAAVAIHDSAVILAVGDELTIGQTLDTNSHWLADRLTSLGVRITGHATIPDDRAALAHAITRAAEQAPLVVMTGGLGPTPDDLTRLALADAMREPLVEDEALLEKLRKRFESLRLAMPESNRVQARRPRSAIAMDNPHGTAPGLIGVLHASGRTCDVFCLPGPPREMAPMFNEHVAPRLRPPTDRVVRTRLLHTVGLGESVIAERLGAMMDRTNTPIVGTTASGAMVTCRIRYEGAEASAHRALEKTEASIRKLLGPHVFGVDDETLPTVVIRTLTQRKQWLVVAESCTGGLLGATLTAAPGASKAFAGGWITYANSMKEQQVGVAPDLIESQGAVSEPVALAMARGALEHAACADHALAVTGVAGPTGASPGKPVGLVYIARCSKESPDGDEVRRFIFGGGRADVRERSVMSAMATLYAHLVGASRERLLWEQPSKA